MKTFKIGQTVYVSNVYRPSEHQPFTNFVSSLQVISWDDQTVACCRAAMFDSQYRFVPAAECFHTEEEAKKDAEERCVAANIALREACNTAISVSRSPGD